MNWWCQERLSAVQLIRHPQTTFPALTSTGQAANGNDCKNCWQSMLLASSRTSKTWATQKPSTIDSAPQTPFLWPSRTDAYLHTNCRRSKSTSRVCWHRMSSSRATVRMLVGTGGHRPQERRGNPPLRRLSQAQCEDNWWCLSSSEDPRVFWYVGRGPVLFDSGPGQRLPSNCHASRWPAQDGLRDADGAVRVHQNADGSVISASDLPTPHAVHDVRLHLPVPAGVPGRSAGVFQDVWRAPCPPGPSSAAHHRRWSEAEDGQVPVSTTPGPLLGAHHLRWGRQLRGREGGSCEELAGAGDHYCSAQLFGLRQLLPTLHPGLLEDCWSPPWPGRQGQRTSQEERGRHLQAVGPAAPEGVWGAEDSPDYSSCPGVCWVHQALHPRDRRQPWRAERHPFSRARWAETGLGLRKSTAASHREEPGQLLQHEAGIPGP